MKTILKKELVLTHKDEKTNIEIPFNIDEHSKALKIHFSYSPKILKDENKAIQLVEECVFRDAGKFSKEKEYKNTTEFLPLKNLVTVCIYSPDGYCGAAHRHDSEQNILLSENLSTDGFQPTKIVVGQWKLVLNTHCVITNCCNCVVEIETEN